MEWSWWVLAFVPGVWLLQNIYHEGSHLLSVWIHYRLKPLAFWPFPHKHEGRWYLARYVHEQSVTPTPEVYIAPLLFNLFYTAGIIIGAAIILSIKLADPTIFLIPFILAPIIDILFWIYGYLWGSPLTDGKKYKVYP